MAKSHKKIWGGIIEYEADDTPIDIHLFNSVGKWMSVWLNQSQALHRAAVAVAEQATIGFRPATDTPVALMLGGYAIEALLKMAAVSDYYKANGYSVDSKAENFLPKTHNLVALAARAKIRTTKKDRELLATLSRFTVWAGRYPIPLFAEGYSGPAMFERAGFGPIRPHPAWSGYQTLYSKLLRLSVRRTFERAALNPDFLDQRP